MWFRRLVLACLSLTVARVCLAVDDSILVPLAQTPPSVQKIIATQIGGGTLEGIYQSHEEGQAVYDVDFVSKAGIESGFTIGADGAIVSVEVGLDDTPAPVRKTILAQAAGWQVDSIDKNLDPGDTTYDIEVSKGADTQDFTVDDDGSLLSMNLPLNQTPDTVASAIQAQAQGAHINSIDKNLDDTDPTYDVEVEADGVSRNFTIGADGSLLDAEIALSETPPSVHATIAQQAQGAAVKSIDETFDPDNGNTFDAVTAAGKSFTVGADGALLSVEVTLQDVSPKARKTIEDQVAGGKVIRIDQALVEKDKGVLPYEVEARKDGKLFDFSVGPKGRFLGSDDDDTGN
jgi:uncharacterized membrane protein YkoI